METKLLLCEAFSLQLRGILEFGKKTHPTHKFKTDQLLALKNLKKNLILISTSLQLCLGCDTVNCPDWISMKRGELYLEHLSYNMI